MRTLLILQTLLFQFPLTLHAQYFVIKVNEKVFADGKLLKPKDRIQSEATLQFSSDKAFAHVISTSKGHFVLSGKEAKKNKNGEFFMALKEAIIAPEEFLAAATRPSGFSPDIVFNDKYDIKAFFGKELWLIDELQLSFNPKKYPLDDQRFFVILHEVKKKFVERQLPVNGQFVTISPIIMLNNKGKDISKKITSTHLVYVDQSKNKKEVLASFKLGYIGETEKNHIKTELQNLYQLVKPSSKEAFVQLQALPYLKKYYGKFAFGEILDLVEGF